MSKKPSPEAQTFFVDTRFQRMARRQGGVPREQALESAQDDVQSIHIDHDYSNMGRRISNPFYDIIEIFAHPPDICDNGRDSTDQGYHRF